MFVKIVFAKVISKTSRALNTLQYRDANRVISDSANGSIASVSSKANFSNTSRLSNISGLSKFSVILALLTITILAVNVVGIDPSSLSSNIKSSNIIDSELNSISGLDSTFLLAPAQSLSAKGPVSTSTFSVLDLIKPINSAVSSAVQSIITPASNWVKLKVNKGDTISAIFSKFGLERTAARNAEVALKNKAPYLVALKSGEELDIELDPSGQIQTLRREVKDGKVFLLEMDASSQFKTTLFTPEIFEQEREVSGVISSSLAHAAKNASIPYEMIDEFVDLLADRVRFERDLHPGDTFSIVYKARTKADGTVIENGAIVSASIMTGGKLIAAVRHTDAQGKARYFNENGESVGGGFLKYPVKFTRISSAFSSNRFHPVLKVHRPHNGVDLAAPTGTPVRTVGDGVVSFSGWKNGGGYTVRIKHNDRWSTEYMHLSKISPQARNGARVARGDVIGNVGATGLATAPHLHFALWDKSKYVNPLGTNLPKIELFKPLDKKILMASLKRVEELHQAAINSPDRMIALAKIPGSSSESVITLAAAETEISHG